MSSQKNIVFVIVFIFCILVLVFGGWFLVQGFLKKTSSTTQKTTTYRAASSPVATPQQSEGGVPLAIRDGVLLVELAKTESELARGLSERQSLSLDRGMLFDLGEERIPSFWMKDMNFALDIIWINAAFVVTDVTKNVSPASFPTLFSPKEPVRYVVETNAGFADTFGIVSGDRVIAPSIEK